MTRRCPGNTREQRVEIMSSTMTPSARRQQRPESRRVRHIPVTAPQPRKTGPGQPRRMHDFFEATCDRTPEALALVAGSEQLTYAELDARANQLAHYLMGNQGIRPGGRIGILLARSTDTYVALLAALKCGAAFVPIDISCPADRIAFMAEDADTALIITTSEFADSIAATLCPVLQ